MRTSFAARFPAEMARSTRWQGPFSSQHPLPARPARSTAHRLTPHCALGGGVVALLVVLLAGCGTMGTPANGGSGPSAPPAPPNQTPGTIAAPGGGDTLGYRFSAVPLHADSNSVVISFTLTPPLDQSRYSTPITWSAQDIHLATADGTELPQEDGQGWSVDPLGRLSPTPTSMRMTFDARGVQAAGSLLPLRLRLHLAGWTSVAQRGPFRGVSTPVPTAVGRLAVHTDVQFDQPLQAPFDAARRIAAPGVRSEAGGVTITLDRVVVTAGETRFYSHVTDAGNTRVRPWGGNFTLHGDGWAMPGLIGGSGPGNPADGSYEFGVTTDLLDQPSPWTLTLPAVSPSAANGLPLAPPAPLVGPWVFLFALPTAGTSATPGLAPPLPPGLSPTPLFPWGVPTTSAPPLPGASLTHVPTP